MNNNYNCNEIINIAIQIERSGSEFYTKAISSSKKKNIKLQLENLAQWEDSHIKKMEDLKDLLEDDCEPFIFPDIDPSSYMQSLENCHIFIKNKDIDKMLKKTKNDRDLLELALEFEKDSVTFYKKIVTNNSSVLKILKLIIKEEESHVEFIKNLINEL